MDALERALHAQGQGRITGLVAAFQAIFDAVGQDAFAPAILTTTSNIFAHD